MRKSELSTENVSAHGLYILEREGKYIVEDARGYATYTYLKDAVYLEDIYVRPEYRKLGAASEFADAVVELALGRGKTLLLGSVAPRSVGATESLKVLLAYGMRLDSSNNDLIYFVKDIKAMEG